jgi:hypothetical protein
MREQQGSDLRQRGMSWRRLARRYEWTAFLVCLARSYRLARRRAQTRLGALEFAVMAARWHRVHRLTLRQPSLPRPSRARRPTLRLGDDAKVGS